jgi:hypothetical protein
MPGQASAEAVPRRGSSSGAEGSRPDTSQAPTDPSVILRRGELYGQGGRERRRLKAGSQAARIWFGSGRGASPAAPPSHGIPYPVAFMSFGSQEGPGMTRVAYCSLTHSPRAESVKIGQREARPDES